MGQITQAVIASEKANPFTDSRPHGDHMAPTWFPTYFKQNASEVTSLWYAYCVPRADGQRTLVPLLGDVWACETDSTQACEDAGILTVITASQGHWLAC